MERANTDVLIPCLCGAEVAMQGRQLALDRKSRLLPTGKQDVDKRILANVIEVRPIDSELIRGATPHS